MFVGFGGALLFGFFLHKCMDGEMYFVQKPILLTTFPNLYDSRNPSR